MSVNGGGALPRRGPVPHTPPYRRPCRGPSGIKMRVIAVCLFTKTTRWGDQNPSPAIKWKNVPFPKIKAKNHTMYISLSSLSLSDLSPISLADLSPTKPTAHTLNHARDPKENCSQQSGQRTGSAGVKCVQRNTFITLHTPCRAQVSPCASKKLPCIKNQRQIRALY